MTISETSTVCALGVHSYYSIKTKELKLLSVSLSKTLEDKKLFLPRAGQAILYMCISVVYNRLKAEVTVFLSSPSGRPIGLTVKTK